MLWTISHYKSTGNVSFSAAYPPPTPPAPAPAPAPPSSLRAALPEESALPPPLPPPPSTPPPHLQTLVSPPLTEVQQPAYGREVLKLFTVGEDDFLRWS